MIINAIRGTFIEEELCDKISSDETSDTGAGCESTDEWRQTREANLIETRAGFINREDNLVFFRDQQTRPCDSTDIRTCFFAHSWFPEF